MYFAILYKPTSEICEVENGVCYDCHTSREKAEASILKTNKPESYEVVVLPDGLIPFQETESGKIQIAEKAWHEYFENNKKLQTLTEYEISFYADGFIEAFRLCKEGKI